MRKIAACLLLLALPCAALAQAPSSRFFYSGSGSIHLVGKGGAFNGRYRNADGTYNEAAMKRINQVYGSRYGVPGASITPRFVEFLNYLADQLSPGATITIASGYRSPTSNTRLRENGKLAAKASLHQYAMAADVKFSGVSSERVWNFIKELGYGGAGFYHGGLVHVDVGPARSWDETTSGVGTDISDDNKLIDLMTDRDIYLPGELLVLQFTRMTAFPIGVSREFFLERVEDGAVKRSIPFVPSLAGVSDAPCPTFTAIDQLANIRWQLPSELAPGRYRITARFCERPWDDMPDAVATRDFEVRKP